MAIKDHGHHDMIISAIIHIITEVGVLCEETIGTARVGAVHICSCWAGGGSGLIYKFLDDKEVPQSKPVQVRPTLYTISYIVFCTFIYVREMKRHMNKYI